MSSTPISEFTGEFEFLSNEFLTPVGYENEVYPSVAHAFQAARTQDFDLRKSISQAHDFSQLYTLSEAIDNPEDWSKQRLPIMERLLRDKFRRSRELQRRLTTTGTRQLLNTYSDDRVPSNLYWGLAHGKGQNQVGVLLMKIRRDIETGREVESWLLSSFQVQTDLPELPVFYLHCYKHDHRTGSQELRGRAYYTIGNARSCDLILTHPSVSRTHACLFMDLTLGPTLVDLNSKAGTFIDGTAIKAGFPAPVNRGDELSFGESNRVFRVEMDFAEASEKLERRKRKLDEELRALERVEEGGDVTILKKHLGLLTSETVLVQNLPYRCDKPALEQLLSVCGEIQKISMTRNRSKTSASVRFRTPENAKSALKYDNLPFQGRTISVTLTDSRESGEDSSD